MSRSNLHFVIENHIPYIKGLLEPYGSVSYLEASDITSQSIADADAIVVRTRTRCDAQLLENSKCQLVVTATIGTDHIDLDWCKAHGIEVASAPGCNAPAVAQYVFSSLQRISNRPLSQYTIGIIGVGNVGKIVEKWAKSLDMEVMLCDPPRQSAEGGNQWSSLEEIAKKADIITFHTPLDATTYHMADSNFFDSLNRRPIIINAARGAIVDNEALLAALNDGKVHSAIIDCWESEPAISQSLLEKCVIATPHIAGYSAEGKTRATRMALDAISKHFSLPHIEMAQPLPGLTPMSVRPAALEKSYNPLIDTAALKSSPSQFEMLRNTYSLRPELH